MRPRYLAQALILFSIPVLVLGQAPDEAKERQARFAALLDETVSDIRDLRLPENRAYSYARAGSVMWELDQTRALSLFRSAGTELSAAMDGFAARQRPGRYYDPNTAVQFRQQVLTTIGEKNAALALDILYKTRPPSVTRAMAPTDPRDNRIGSYQNNGLYIAQNEAYLESSLYRLAADQDPARAVAILKAALAKPPSQSTFDQLTRLAEKDASAATDAGNDVIRRLSGAAYIRDGQTDYQMISLTNQIIDHAINRTGDGEKLRFDPGAVRDLAVRTIAAYVSNASVRPYFSTETLLRYAEKFSPASVSQLKQLDVQQPADPSSETTEYSKLMQADTTPEEMVAGAGRLSTGYRGQVYTSASNKLLEQNNVAAARAVIEQNFVDDARDQALISLDQQQAYRLMNETKFNEAESVINTMPEPNRVEMLVQLANRAYSSNKEQNRAYALSLLGNARGSVGDEPADNQAMSQLMRIAGGFAQIDPSQALDIMERIAPKTNELCEAAAVLWSFQDHNAVRDGEFIITQGNGFTQFGINTNILGQLASADLERTIKLVDGFSRPEMRVALRLQMLSNGRRGIGSLPIQRTVMFDE